MNVPPAFNGWGEKWKGELLRLFIILIVSLGISYLALSRKSDELDRGFRSNCQHIESIRQNQERVLFSLLAITDLLNDRQKAGLRKLPNSIRTQIIVALSEVPDARNCNSTTR